MVIPTNYIKLLLQQYILALVSDERRKIAKTIIKSGKSPSLQCLQAANGCKQELLTKNKACFECIACYVLSGLTVSRDFNYRRCCFRASLRGVWTGSFLDSLVVFYFIISNSNFIFKPEQEMKSARKLGTRRFCLF